jgi:hypothetical protein
MSEQRGLFEVLRVHEWVARDCPVKNCIDGIIPTDKGVYRCPECKRNTMMAIPVFRGFQPKFSDWEMEERKKDRQQVVSDADFRLRRGKEMFNAIISLWSKDRKKKKKVFISDSEVPF